MIPLQLPLQIQHNNDVFLSVQQSYLLLNSVLAPESDPQEWQSLRWLHFPEAPLLLPHVEGHVCGPPPNTPAFPRQQGRPAKQGPAMTAGAWPARRRSSAMSWCLQVRRGSHWLHWEGGRSKEEGACPERNTSIVRQQKPRTPSLKLDLKLNLGRISH